MKTRGLTLAVVLTAGALAASNASADTYFVTVASKDQVNLIDTTSVQKSGNSLYAWALVVKRHPYFPEPSGPVAFAMIREAFDCQKASFHPTVFKEFGEKGAYRNATVSPDDPVLIPPGSPNAEFVRHACSGAELDKARLVKEESPVLAYRYSRGLMDQMNAGFEK